MRISKPLSVYGACLFSCLLVQVVDARAQTPTPPATGAEAAPEKASPEETAADPSAAPDQPDAPAPATTPAPSAATPAPAAMAIGSEALRQTCEKAIGEDTEWRTQLKENLARRIFEAPQNARDEALRDMVRREAHEAETVRLTRNNNHVIYAYGALWILTALFVLYMFIRQRSLNDEIARLRRELEKAL